MQNDETNNERRRRQVKGKELLFCVCALVT